MKKYLFVLFAWFICFNQAAVADDASAQFSPTLNPSGNWSYGWSPSLGGSFNLYTQQQARNGIDFWFEPLTTGPSPGYPLLGHVPANASISIPGIIIAANQLVLHPGAGNEYSVLRWVAPQSMEVTLTADYSRVDFVGPTTTDVHVLVDGTGIYTGAINASSASASFASTIAVAQGATIDFAVGYGTNGNYINDGTGLFATVTPVPEPASYVMMIAGLGLLGFAVRRQHRA